MSSPLLIKEVSPPWPDDDAKQLVLTATQAAVDARNDGPHMAHMERRGTNPPADSHRPHTTLAA